MSKVRVRVTVKSITLCGILIYAYLTHKLVKSFFKGNRYIVSAYEYMTDVSTSNAVFYIKVSPYVQQMSYM